MCLISIKTAVNLFFIRNSETETSGIKEFQNIEDICSISGSKNIVNKLFVQDQLGTKII